MKIYKSIRKENNSTEIKGLFSTFYYQGIHHGISHKNKLINKTFNKFFRLMFMDTILPESRYTLKTLLFNAYLAGFVSGYSRSYLTTNYRINDLDNYLRKHDIKLI